MCAWSRDNHQAPNLATRLQGTASTPAGVIDSSPSPGGRGHGRAPDPTRRPPRAPRIDAGQRHDLTRGRRTRPGAALWATSSPEGAGKRRGRDHSSHQGPYGEAGRRRARAAARPATTTPLRTPHRGRNPERSHQTRGEPFRVSQPTRRRRVQAAHRLYATTPRDVASRAGRERATGGRATQDPLHGSTEGRGLPSRRVPAHHDARGRRHHRAVSVLRRRGSRLDRVSSGRRPAVDDVVARLRVRGQAIDARP